MMKMMKNEEHEKNEEKRRKMKKNAKSRTISKSSLVKILDGFQGLPLLL